MARFDVYPNPESSERRATPYFLDVQNDFIDGLGTRVVIPLRRESMFGPRAKRLNPLVRVGDEAVVLDTAALGAVPVQELKRTVTRIAEDRAAVQEALDALFGGY